MLILNEVQHNLREEALSCCIVADTGHINDVIHAAFSDAPVGLIGFLLVELEQTIAEEALRNLFADDWEVDNSLLPHLQVRILTQ